MLNQDKKMNIKASFLTVEDSPPDLILAFAQNEDPIGGCKSLILIRTKEHEKFIMEAKEYTKQKKKIVK